MHTAGCRGRPSGPSLGRKAVPRSVPFRLKEISQASRSRRHPITSFCDGMILWGFDALVLFVVRVALSEFKLTYTAPVDCVLVCMSGGLPLGPLLVKEILPALKLRRDQEHLFCTIF